MTALVLRPARGVASRLIALVAVTLLAACAVQLAPAYDPALVEALDAANARTLTLFAELEDGAPAATYADYRDDYATVIGGFEALRLRAAKRPIPPLAKRLEKVRFVADFCNSSRAELGEGSCVNASPISIGTIVETVRALRQRHRTVGLQSGDIALARSRYDLLIDRAMVVEAALKR